MMNSYSFVLQQLDVGPAHEVELVGNGVADAGQLNTGCVAVVALQQQQLDAARGSCASTGAAGIAPT